MDFLGIIVGLMVVGYLLYGFHHDGILEKLEHKKILDLTIGDFSYIALGIILILLFLKLLSDLF